MLNKMMMISNIEQAKIRKMIAYETDDLKAIFESEFEVRWLIAINLRQRFLSNKTMNELKQRSLDAVKQYLKECDYHG